MGELDVVTTRSAEERARRLLGSVVEVSLSAIRVETQQRRVFDPQPMEMLTRSIERFGLAEPLQAYAGPLDENGVPRYYVLCAGERRFRACQSLGIATVRVTVVGLVSELATPDGRRQFHRRQYEENSTHEPLNAIEDAAALRQMMTDIEASEPGLEKRVVVSRICEERGLSKSELYNRLRLLELGDGLQDAVARSDASRARLYALVREWSARVSDGWPRETAELGRKALERLRKRAGWPAEDTSRLDRLRVLASWEGYELHLAAHCEESLVRRDVVERSLAAHVEAVERIETWFREELRKASEPKGPRAAKRAEAAPASETQGASEVSAGDGGQDSEPVKVGGKASRRRPPVAARSRSGDRLVVQVESIKGASRAELADAEMQVLDILRAVQAAMQAAL